MAYSKFWSELREKKLKGIWSTAKDADNRDEQIEKWRHDVSPNEAPKAFLGRCCMKAKHMGITRDDVRHRSWIGDLTKDRRNLLKLCWMDVAKYPHLSDLLAVFPEAGNIDSLRTAVSRYFHPALPSRAELLNKQKQEQPATTPVDNNGDKKGKRVVTILPLLDERAWPEPQTLTITPEAWKEPGKRVGGLSCILCESKGFRSAMVDRAFRQFAERGCCQIGLDGGLADRIAINERINAELARYDRKDRGPVRAEIERRIVCAIASELHSIIPVIKKPAGHGDKTPNVRLYIMTSPMIDGVYGEKVAAELQKLRPDMVRVYSPGGDRTRVKGIGLNEEERKLGIELGWINPKKSRLPGKYASTGIDKDIHDEGKAADSLPALWICGGYGVSVSKPGFGSKKRPYISLPGLNKPTPRRPGDPVIQLNQIGFRVIVVSSSGETTIETWSMRDLVKDERSFVGSVNKRGTKPVHRHIVDALRGKPLGLHVGELADALEVPQSVIAKEIGFLVEERNGHARSWPGLYKDKISERFKFHADYLQHELRYPWPYGEGVHELRELVFGCLHAGYTTTDYEFVRHSFVKIILENRVDALELIGDITAGLKHHLMHRGEIIGNMNYTEQEILAGELLATVIYDVFVVRFGEALARTPSGDVLKKLESLIASSLILFLWIVGNHEAWQRENGHTPGFVFRATLTTTLHCAITEHLRTLGLTAANLFTIIEGKMVELSEDDAQYTFPDDIRTEFIHPCMARAQTTSLRTEEVLNFCSGVQLTRDANFHTGMVVEDWDPDLGQRQGIEAATMVICTKFENGKLKRVDFGPTLSVVRSKKSRIFFTSHRFFPVPILQKPISKNTNPAVLRKKLGLLHCPLIPTWQE